MKKSYGDKKKRRRRRNWKLKGLDKEMAGIDQDSLDGYCNCFDGFIKDVFALLGAWPVLGVWPILGAWPVLALISCFFVCKNDWKGGC